MGTGESLPPHFGTQAAVRAVQPAIDTAKDQIHKLTASQSSTLPSLPDLTFAKQTGQRCMLRQYSWQRLFRCPMHAACTHHATATVQLHISCVHAAGAVYMGVVSNLAQTVNALTAPLNNLSGSAPYDATVCTLLKCVCRCVVCKRACSTCHFQSTKQVFIPRCFLYQKRFTCPEVCTGSGLT